MLTPNAGMGLVLICCGACAFAQNHVQVISPEAQRAPILLNVQVTDKAGHPITGLKQSDFTVLDDGKPAPIQLFAALPGAGPDAASIMLLIDDVNVSVGGVVFVREQVAKFLRSYGEHLPGPVSISVLSENGVNEIVAPLTDGNRLAWELEQTLPHLRPVPATADWGAQERFTDSIEGLEKITNYQLRRPGRMLLIWISPGWSLFENAGQMITDEQQQYWMKMIVTLSSGLRDARITLDEVNPAGPMAGLTASQWESFLKPVKKESDAYPTDLALQVLASESGGRVLYESNEPAQLLSECLEDATVWYAIRFDRAASKKPDTWHDVKVKVDRPDVVVRTNNGYYAQP
jgi:VWFA-related protein